MASDDKARGEAGLSEAGRDFIRDIVKADLDSGCVKGAVTRFPPEPNGYLHIGHAKSICLNFGIAEEFGGRCHLRFDDTNPDQGRAGVRRFDQATMCAGWVSTGASTCIMRPTISSSSTSGRVHLIQAGKAYVDDLTPEEIRANRGTLTEPGKNSPFRDRPVEENLDLFQRMRAGEFPDGARVLRAKIDMASPNINMRDPVLYRILHAQHHRTGDDWCIYPMYDFAHRPVRCASKASPIRSARWSSRITGRFMTGFSTICRCRRARSSIEFARLNLTYTVMSKRKLTRAGRDGHVSGWDDPRMPTLAGLRRRGFPPEAIAISSSASALPKPTALSMWACSTSPFAKSSGRRPAGRGAHGHRPVLAVPHPRRSGHRDPGLHVARAGARSAGRRTLGRVLVRGAAV